MVAQVTLNAPITESTQLRTFDIAPSPEVEPVIRAQLIEEIEARAQRLLTEQLAAQPGFLVVPFADTRRVIGNLASLRARLSEAQLRMVGTESGADLVVTSRVLDYGAVHWQY